MSASVKPRQKVSREGLVLIKSFEGFRPRAVRSGDGWLIGYGHSVSAREGARVSEAEAELLLQYDLAPIVKALNAFPVILNPHQFDALASFALSLGADRFLASETARRLASGELAQAADAMFASPATPRPDAGLQRRAAERALFVADPDTPTRLSDLLSAPLAPFPETSRAEARAAAVAALLGEPEALAPFPVSDDGAELAPWSADTPPLETPASTSRAADDIAPADGALPAPPSPVDASVEPEAAEPETTPAGERVMHHEVVRSGARIDWTEAGLYLVMGGLGLVACAFAGAALRWSLLRPGSGGEPGVIAGALAIIGVLCVGVSAWNLHTCLRARD